MTEYTGEVTVNVVENNSEYLIARRTSDQKWEFVGGKVEQGETVKEAAIRELEEETGLEGEVVEISGSYPSRAAPEWTLRPVHMRAESREVDLSREHDRYEWIDLDDIKDFDTLGQEKSLELLGLLKR